MVAPHLDPSLAVSERVEYLIGEMTLAEKVGQLFHTMALVGPGGSIVDGEAMGLPGQRTLVVDRLISHFNMLGAGSATDLARWHNNLQDLARETRLEIPITLSTDPRHSFTNNVGTGSTTAAFSGWPEALGLAAIGDVELVRQFADICRTDYLAVGIRVALHPQLDIASEPRWARVGTTFGENVDLVAALAAAYVEGLGAHRASRESVAAMIKHFPGGGPLRDGEDSHFAAGKAQIYPAGMFDRHIEPFRHALAAGARQVMPSYGMLLGTAFEEVGCGFNKSLLTGLLRTELGFDGIICTDWGLITDAVILGQDMPARAWGVEHLSEAERIQKALDAGVDQFGGEHCTGLVIDLVASGHIAEERIDRSVRRLLREKFDLGLFDARFVDVGAAAGHAGTTAQRDLGRRTQARAVTVLTNGPPADPVLPLPKGARVVAEGFDPAVFTDFATLVPDDADVAIVRIAAPFEERPGGFQSRFHSGSLEFDTAEIERLLALMRRQRTVLVVHLDRPAILTPFVDAAAAIVVEFGCSDAALIEAPFWGRAADRSASRRTTAFHGRGRRQPDRRTGLERRSALRARPWTQPGSGLAARNSSATAASVVNSMPSTDFM